MNSKLADFHVVVQTDMPWSHMTSVYEELMPQLDITDDQDFAIMQGDESNASTYEITHTGGCGAGVMSEILCFRQLRSSPSSMHVLPDAPKVTDSKAFVSVLEHTVAPCGKLATAETCRVLLTRTETDLDSRTILVTLGTFSYDELRGMQRARPDTNAIYDFDSLAHESMTCSHVGSLVVQGLLHTLDCGHRPYIIDVTTDRKQKQLDVMQQLQQFHLAYMHHVGGEEYHCRLTHLGGTALRTSFRMVDHEVMSAPLHEHVPSPC